MEPKRVEIAHRAPAIGGGFQLALIAVDGETGQEIYMGSEDFPSNDFISDDDAFDEAYKMGNAWIQHALPGMGKELCLS